jgi:hypothetical protein
VGVEKEVLVGAEVEREASGAGIGQREGVTVHQRKPREVSLQAVVVSAGMKESRVASDRWCKP